MSEKKNTTPKRRQSTRLFTSTAREMAESIPNGQLVIALCAMASFIMRFTPKGGELARDIHLAIGRAWMDYRHHVGDDAWNSPTERRAADLHSKVLIALRTKARETDNPPAEIPDGSAPHTTEPIDLNLWRQVHPRTIKRCIVDVKGGA